MNVSVIGLGYVGLTVSACLSDLGHKIIGVDIDTKKIKEICKGNFIINEESIGDILSKNVLQNKIYWTTDYDYALNNSDIVFICVDTPIDSNGMLYMDNIYSVADRISTSIKESNKYLTIVVRSTVNLGTNHKIIEIIKQSIDPAQYKNFDVVSNPEFLREGSAVKDFYNPPYTIVGTKSEKSIKIIKKLYSKIDGEMIFTDPKVAELIKIVNNSFHALKVSFANEIGRLCNEINIDSNTLMDLFVKDEKLNISSYYFKPGFAYGGSCLAKDLQSLNTIIESHQISAPVLKNISESNKNHIDYIANRVIKKQNGKVGLYGLAFKAKTADLRSSASLELAKILINEDIELTIFDSYLDKTYLLNNNINKSKSDTTVYSHLETSLEKFAHKLDVLVLINADDNIDELLLHLDNSVKIFDYTNSKVLSDYSAYNSF